MNDALRQLGDDYWDFAMEAEPVWATMLGDHRFNDRLPDLGPEQRRQGAQKVREFLERLEKIQPENEQDRISADVLRLNCVHWLDEDRYGFWQWNLDHLNGPHVWMLELLNYQPLKTDRDYRDLLARYQAFPRLIEQLIANLQQGVAEGRTAPRMAVERVRGQLEGMLQTPPAESPLRPPERWDAEIEQGVGEVYRGLKALSEYLKGYQGRDAVGLSALPDGAAAYAHRIRLHTTTEMSATAIHEYGHQQVMQLTAQMRQVARELGHDGTLETFRAELQQRPDAYYTSREEIVESAREWLTRLTAMLPKWFGRLPKAECTVKAIETFREKDCVAAFYYPPNEDFSRPGTYYVNAYEPTTRPRFNMAALAVHEAVPGHHLQIALAMELGELPRFRRNGMFTAFIEGWALYTERLGTEMGVYEDPLSRFGMLTYQAWRAARLVVDTGMHALGWSRDKAIDYFREYVGLPKGEIDNEIDRYIIWPGQALAYAIGMR
ncbi:MAG: DUF885 domain-containing protein, partial [Candidatus Xenobia bacterium]